MPRTISILPSPSAAFRCGGLALPLLPGLVIYSPRALTRNSRTQEGCKKARFTKKNSRFHEFLIQKIKGFVISQHSLLLLVMLLCLVPAGAAAAPHDDAFLRLWSLHRQATADTHAAVITACREAARHTGADGGPLLGRYLPAARTIEAWHLLQAGRTAEAVAAYESVLAGRAPADPLRTASETMARRWLTRLDREKVVDALTAHYREAVAYPDDLKVFETWPKERRPPLRDRLGDAWIYQLQAFRRLRLDSPQRYILYSRAIGRKPSELGAALALRPPATEVSFVRRGTGAPAMAQVRIGGAGGRTATIQEGGRVGGLLFAAIDSGGRFALFSDDDFWLVALPPGEGRR
jgi:hypothetical protein